MTQYVMIEKDLLERILANADSYVQDVDSGLQDGTYDEEDNEGHDQDVADVETVQALLAQDTGGCCPYLDLSTAHVRKETMAFLAEADPVLLGMTIANYEYGCFVSVPSDPVRDDPKGLPEDLITVLEFAQKQKCFVVRLDADGNTHDALPAYDW